MKTLLRAALTVLCGLALAGCEFQGVTTIKPEGSGEFRSEVGYSPEERQNLEDQQTGGASDFCATTQQSQGLFPPDIVVTEEQRGDETWCVTTTRFASLDELRELYQSKTGLTINRLEIANDNLFYDIDIDTESEDSSFRNFTAITWKVELPGEPLDHNADLAGGKSLSWNIKPQNGVANLHVISAVDGPPLDPFTLVVGVAIGMAAVGGLAILLRRRPPG